MALIAQDTARLSSVLKYEFEPNTGFCREVVEVYSATETVIKPGTVIGYDSVGEDNVVIQPGQPFVGVTINESDVAIPAGGTVKILVIENGPATFAKQALVLGASVDTDAEKKAVYEAMKAKLVKVSDQI